MTVLASDLSGGRRRGLKRVREVCRVGGAGRGRGKKRRNSDAEEGGEGREDVGGVDTMGTRRLTARQQAMEARLKEEREGGPKPAFILLPRCCSLCKPLLPFFSD